MFFFFSTNLAIDDDWAVHVGSNEGSAKGIEIGFKGGSGIANGDAVVSEAREFLLETLNNVMEADHLLDFNFAFLLGDIDNFDFATTRFGPLLELCGEFDLLCLDGSAYIFLEEENMDIKKYIGT